MNSKKEKKHHSNITHYSNTGLSIHGCHGCNFEIRVKGQLSALWADWFEGLTIQQMDEGEMLLAGYIEDQAALMGVLNKLSRLNLKIISLNEKK